MEKVKEILVATFCPILVLMVKLNEAMKGLVKAMLSNFLKIISVVLGLIVLWAVFSACSKGIFEDEGKIKVTTSLGDVYYID